MKNIDRYLGTLFIFLAIASVVIVITQFSFSWSWLLMVLWTIGISAWIWTGFRLIEIGWRGQLLYLGERMKSYFGEGWRWAPFPFGIKTADCRAKPKELDDIKVFTSDTLEVTIKNISIVWQIVDLSLYFDMDPDKLETLLDDVVDRNVRAQVRANELKKVLGMNLGTDKIQTGQDLSEFGIRVIRIIVPEIVPTNPKILEDVELKQAEKLERDGQRVQARHQADLVKFFSGTEKLGDEGPTGPGLSPDLAYEASLIHMDKAEKKKLASNTFGLDVATVKALVEAVTGRK